MDLSTEQDINEARVFHIASEVLNPLLEKRIAQAERALLQDFRQGAENILPRTAELNAITALRDEITRKAKTYAAMEEKYARTDRK